MTAPNLGPTSPDLDVIAINLTLTDADRQVISDATRPLPPRDRPAFVRAVTEALRGVERGPGVVHRACATLQRQFFDPPLEADGERR